MPKHLELFSGTGSVGWAFEALGWDVISLDIDPKANATYCCDIMDFDWRSIGPVDVIWSSPSCTKYSVARTQGPEDDLQSSDALVRKTLEIAEALGNPPLFCENPYTGQLKNRGIIELPMQKVDYCVYGFPYRKRTAIWTNTDWVPARRLCKHDCWASVGRKHFAWAQKGPPGPFFTQSQLYRIPPELCDEIAAFCNALVLAPGVGDS